MKKNDFTRKCILFNKMEFRDEYKDRSRASHYSILYDSLSELGGQIKTASEKFIWQGATACKILVQLHMLTETEAEYFIQNFLRVVDAKTMNGAAFALVFTVYDIGTKTWVIDPKEFLKKHGHLNEKLVKEKSWSGLMLRLKKIDKQNKDFKELVEKYGMNPESLLRYLLFIMDYFSKHSHVLH